jgi:hypothetical protein
VRALGIEEIVDLESYSRLRREYRRRVIEYKRSRRLAVGERVSLLFEDRETLRFQVQEMLFVERISDPEKVQHELDVYNELVPGEGELSATLFIEIGESTRIRAELDRLVGLDEHLLLVVGAGDESAIRAAFDPRQRESDRISAVQYVRFTLSREAVARFCDPALRAVVRVDHPAYTEEAEIPADVRASLVATLTREPECLLPGATGLAPSRDVVELETTRVRVLRAGGSPDHWIVEPVERCSLLAADRELLVELTLALQTAVARLAERHGGVRIEAVEAAAGAPLRWRLSARAPARSASST